LLGTLLLLSLLLPALQMTKAKQKKPPPEEINVP
jgi:hypothetical protein